MTTKIEDMIRLEHEAMRIAIFPWERREHAEKIVKLERIRENQQHGWLEIIEEVDDQG